MNNKQCFVLSGVAQGRYRGSLCNNRSFDPIPQSSHAYIMIQLLDLPTEILEMVIERIGCPPPPAFRCYSYVSEGDRRKRAILHTLLKLRLVHSRFRSLVDPFVFSSFDCLIGNINHFEIHGPNQLLGLEHIARHAKSVRLAVEVQSITVEGSMARRINGLLQFCATVLENLEVVAKSNLKKSYLYTGVFSLPFSKLRSLNISDVAFFLCLPDILKLAPRLDYVTLGAASGWYIQAKEMDAAIDDMSAVWDDSWRPNRSLETLILRNTEPWMECLVARFKLPTKRIIVQSEYEIPRYGSQRIKISSNAFLYLGEIEDFKAFSLSSTRQAHVRE